MTYTNITNHIRDLDLIESGTYRGKCPACHSYNTFTVSNDMGNLMYNCYKAGCSVSGTLRTNASAESIMRKLRLGDGKEEMETAKPEPFNLPVYVSDCVWEDIPRTAKAFLHKWDIHPDDVMYDVKDDRVVFPVLNETGGLVDAVGRAVDPSLQPKWLRYGSSSHPYTAGAGTGVCVVVEDAISAHKVDRIFPDVTGVALLGTQLSLYHKQYLKDNYHTVLVALDPDARDKGIDMALTLRGWGIEKVRAVNLTDDIKYENNADLLNIKEHIDG